MRGLASFLLLLLAGCAQPQEPTLEVSPSSATLALGQKLQLAVTRRFPSGPIELVTDRVDYLPSNVSVTSVSASGEVFAAAVGPVIVHIADRDSEAVVAATFTVAAPAP